MTTEAPAIDQRAPVRLVFNGPGQRTLFAGVRVKRILNAETCEDGETVNIMADLVDGSVVSISLCPGAAITAAVVG